MSDPVLENILSAVVSSGPVATLMGVWLWTTKQHVQALMEELKTERAEKNELVDKLLELASSQVQASTVTNERLLALDKGLGIKELLTRGVHHGG